MPAWRRNWLSKAYSLRPAAGISRLIAEMGGACRMPEFMPIHTRRYVFRVFRRYLWLLDLERTTGCILVAISSSSMRGGIIYEKVPFGYRYAGAYFAYDGISVFAAAVA